MCNLVYDWRCVVVSHCLNWKMSIPTCMFECGRIRFNAFSCVHLNFFPSGFIIYNFYLFSFFFNYLLRSDVIFLHMLVMKIHWNFRNLCTIEIFCKFNSFDFVKIYCSKVDFHQICSKIGGVIHTNRRKQVFGLMHQLLDSAQYKGSY